MLPSFMIYDIDPCPAPRMTRSDKWRYPRRSCVQKYFDFRDKIKSLGVTFENGDSIIFKIPMPDTWSEKKKSLMDGKPHQQRPDIDNLEKGFFDSIFNEDSHIWHIGVVKKIWSKQGAIEVTKTK